jgi:hypothetical protein
MKRFSAAIAAAALVCVGTLTGCSGGDGSDYCNRVRDNAENDTLENINANSPDGIEQFLAEVKKLRADAPSEVQGDYDTVIDAYGDPGNAEQKEVTSAIEKIQSYDEGNCDVKYENS